MPLFNRLTRRPIIYGLDLFSFNHDRLIIFFYVWKKFSNESRKKWIRLQQVQDAIQQGPTEAWTRIIGFRFRSANHCTIRPYTASGTPSWTLKPSQCKDVFLRVEPHQSSIMSSKSTFWLQFQMSKYWKWN